MCWIWRNNPDCVGMGVLGCATCSNSKEIAASRNHVKVLCRAKQSPDGSGCSLVQPWLLIDADGAGWIFELRIGAEWAANRIEWDPTLNKIDGSGAER